MTPGQFKARLSALGMGPRELAAAYGANPRTAQRWVTGKADIPRDMEQWLDEYESRSL
mgnify:FL=1